MELEYGGIKYAVGMVKQVGKVTVQGSKAERVEGCSGTNTIGT